MINIEPRCPCTVCLCKPICRSKKYVVFIKECSIAREYMLYHNIHWVNEGNDVFTHRRRFLKLYNILRPTKWYVQKFESSGYTIKNRKDERWGLQSHAHV